MINPDKIKEAVKKIPESFSSFENMLDRTLDAVKKTVLLKYYFLKVPASKKHQLCL